MLLWLPSFAKKTISDEQFRSLISTKNMSDDHNVSFENEHSPTG